MTEINIDPLKCMSIKNKTCKTQCPHLKKLGSDYCGIHGRSKNVCRINTILTNSINSTNDVTNGIKILHKNIKVIDTNNVTIKRDVLQKKVYNLMEIFNCSNLNDLTVPNLRHTINTLNSTEMEPLIDKTKRSMYSHLFKYYQKRAYYAQNIDKVVKSQRIIKNYFNKRRNKCINDYDLYTIEDKHDIPLKYFFDIIDPNGYTYCFDIRTFTNILACHNPTNPYTQFPITQEAIDKYVNKINYLKKRGINVDFEQDKVTADQAFTHRMIDIFHKFDMLDNYTDHRWFEDLNIKQLKSLYKKAEDVWNYRSQLTPEQKSKIVTGGSAFTISIEYIHYLKNNQKRQLQNIILDEFERFVTEGIDINEKKLGAMLMLTALVEVSLPAANALPHLIQYID